MSALRMCLATTLNVPHALIALRQSGELTWLEIPITRFAYNRLLLETYSLTFDDYMSLHDSWDREPREIPLQGMFALLACSDSRAVAVSKLTHMYAQRNAIIDGMRFYIPIEATNTTVFANRLSKTVKEHFPDFYEAQTLDHARAVIAKLDRRAPKPTLKKPKPPLTRLANERWWHNQTRL